MSNSSLGGYVQGMSDLCAPIYVVMGTDEELTFWCFVQYMNRMVYILLTICSNLYTQFLTEAQFLARSIRHEEAPPHPTTAYRGYGS